MSDLVLNRLDFVDVQVNEEAEWSFKMCRSDFRTGDLHGSFVFTLISGGGGRGGGRGRGGDVGLLVSICLD